MATQATVTQATMTQATVETQHAGQWYVAAFSDELTPGKTLVKSVADQELVFWRTADDTGMVQAASAVCPHWGGPLGEGQVKNDDSITCPWHGWQFRNGYCLERPRLRLPRYLAHDDGIVLWVRLPWNIDKGTEPPLQVRPEDVYSFWFEVPVESDVYHVQENYLDFLHPAEYHTSIFSHCAYLGKDGDANIVELAYKMPLGRKVITRTRVFAPTPYQVRNEVFDGLGTGTVIESHLTPVSSGQTMIREIYHVPARLVPDKGWTVMRFFIERSARRIRKEDAHFSKRRYELRLRGFVDGRGLPVQGRIAPYVGEWLDSPDADAAVQRISDLIGKTAPSHY